jgi:ATP phosphoribosyltransferase
MTKLMLENPSCFTKFNRTAISARRVEVHSVIDKDSFGIMDQLKQVGAEGILICPIEKMVL